MMEKSIEERPGARVRRRALLPILAVLVVATIWPVVFSCRLISHYAAVPQRTAVEISRADSGGAVAGTMGWDDTLLLIDPDGRRVVELSGKDFKDQKVLVALPEDQVSARLTDVAISPSEKLYVLDAEDGAVRIYSKTGEPLGKAPVGHPSARALVVDAAGNLFIGDVGVGMVSKFGPDLQPDLTWGDPARPGTVQIGDVVDLAVSGSDLFATIATPPTFLHLDANGRVADRMDLGCNGGRIEATPAGRVYHLEGSTGRVWVFDRHGKLLHRLAKPDGDEELAIQAQDLMFTRGADLVLLEPRQVVRLRIGTR